MSSKFITPNSTKKGKQNLSMAKSTAVSKQTTRTVLYATENTQQHTEQHPVSQLESTNAKESKLNLQTSSLDQSDSNYHNQSLTSATPKYETPEGQGIETKTPPTPKRPQPDGEEDHDGPAAKKSKDDDTPNYKHKYKAAST